MPNKKEDIFEILNLNKYNIPEFILNLFLNKYYKHSINFFCLEALHIRLKYNGDTAYFLACYKSPCSNCTEFIECLYSKVSSLVPKEPLFIIGDLNMDPKSYTGKFCLN